VNEPAEILIVEDNQDELDVALRAMQRAGVCARIAVARDGQEALEALGLEPGLQDPPLRPRVIFLDLKMPRIDGWEVLRRLRSSPTTRGLPERLG